MQEEWKEVVGFEEYFSVSNLGRVLSKRTGKILKQYLSKSGRMTIATKIGGRKGDSYCFRVHRLVAEAFLSNPENKPQVNHIDGNPKNNELSNLEWATASENIRHAYDNNLRTKPPTGFDSPLSVLTTDQVLFIRAVCKPRCRKLGCRAIARMFNVSHQTVSDALSSRTY